jgi:predicted ester cyclase
MSIERTREVMNRYWDSEHKDVSMMADQAVLEAEFVGKHIGEFAGMPATGRSVRVPLCVIYDLEAGKIKRARVYMETPVLMRQLSAAPAAAGAATG